VPSEDTIQARFKRWREKSGHSLREVREAANAHLPEERRVSVGTVSNYETSNMAPPRSDFVAALKRAYPDLNTTWLLTGEGEMTEIRSAAARAMELGAMPARTRLPMDAGALNTLIAAWAELVEAHPGEPGDVVGGGETVSGFVWTRVQEAVAAPLTALEGLLEVSPGDAFSDFAASVALAIRRYVRANPPRTRTTSDNEEEE